MEVKWGQHTNWSNYANTKNNSFWLKFIVEIFHEFLTTFHMDAPVDPAADETVNIQILALTLHFEVNTDYTV